MQQIWAKRQDTTGVGGMIHLELCKKLKFDHFTKWYMRNTESVLENETRKFLWVFEIT